MSNARLSGTTTPDKVAERRDLHHKAERRTYERLAPGIHGPRRPADPGGLDHQKRRANGYRVGLGNA